ncbi:MAG: gamma-glutamylcyclotransferase [Lachnospiraceae bacterium]|nr:gamma-glutamylcyclotransferase [Lachnospiraceae bacterium]
MSRLYVAYGSNLNKAQMKHRCPGASVRGVGYLNNWELIYRGSGSGSYCSVRRKKGKRVPVAIWYINDRNEHSLDLYEGYPRFYQKQNVYVTLQDGSRVKAMIYIMNTYARPGRPSRAYVYTITQGYKDFGLDIRFLQESLLLNDLEMQKEGR